jgi:hypothetical protein
MTIISTIIREPGDRSAAETLKPLICQYLATFAGGATVREDTRLHALGRDEGNALALISIEVDGNGVSDLDDLARKLHRFLRQTAKDAGLVAGFEVFEQLPRAEGRDPAAGR